MCSKNTARQTRITITMARSIDIEFSLVVDDGRRGSLEPLDIGQQGPYALG
jgi:hypothetical protein